MLTARLDHPPFVGRFVAMPRHAPAPVSTSQRPFVLARQHHVPQQLSLFGPPRSGR